MWQATMLTLFPEMFPGPLGVSLVGKALESGIWALETVDIRDFARDKHRSVDDTPAGGGPGMVMRADVLGAAVDQVMTSGADRPTYYMSPRGRRLKQAEVRKLAEGPGVNLICGRFEGVDERVLEARAIEEISLGDFVLSGGELAAMAMVDAVVRLLPGVLGDQASTSEESFENGLLEYPQYTRPVEWEGLKIPDVLLSGHHGRVAEWRREKSKEITKARRPDLWEEFERQVARSKDRNI